MGHGRAGAGACRQGEMCQCRAYEGFAHGLGCSMGTDDHGKTPKNRESAKEIGPPPQEKKSFSAVSSLRQTAI